jgi:pimeloyl-ACP methyl ester carboxylesterase
MFRSERTIHRDGIDLAVEAFGSRTDPPVVLVADAMTSMLGWPDPFCAALAARRRYVLRYDHRDTGRSTCCPPGAPDYGPAALVEDIFRLLDGYGLTTAHLAGMALGGVLAQRAALARRDRIVSLTAIAATPLGTGRALPPMSAAYAAHAATGETVDWDDPTQVAAYLARDAAARAGTAHPHDPDAARLAIQREIDRSVSHASALNHLAVLGAADAIGRAEDLALPVLAIHGTADPVFSHAHGMALADAVPDARLMLLNGAGHELHPADWNRIVVAIADHTASAGMPPAVARRTGVR